MYYNDQSPPEVHLLKLAVTIGFM